MITAMIAAAAIDYAVLFDKATTMRNAEFDQHVNRLASAYPGLVRASELGKTDKGTPIRLLTVTDRSVDDESRKVGYYIQGGIHVKEMSGAPAALYVASRLAETHRPGGILEKSVFYIVPRCVPDGADLMAQTQGNLRSAWGEELKEGDSLLEPCDINGDGKISHMVFEWPTSNLVRSKRDPRCFVHRSRSPEIKGPFYAFMEEGVFHNWNGKLPTIPWPRYFWREYLDYNRNWEPGWSANTPGAGKSPLNVPETRLQADFLLAHKNIRFAIALHNGYGMVFVSQVRDDILPRYLSVAERLSAMTGFPVLKEWEEHDQKGVANVKRTGFFTEFCYWKAGIPCLTMELGTVETSCGLDAREMFKRADPYTAPYEVIEAEDAHPEFEKSWLPWKKVKHPQLGEVEVGGLLGTVFACPRPRDLEKTCERLFQFVQSHVVDLISETATEKEMHVETDAMKPFPVLKPVPERMRDENRGFQSAPSLTVSPKGRLWVAWHTGDTTEGDENGMVVVSSGGGGATWTPPIFAIDPPGPLRILDPGLWTDPNGKVWLFYAQLYSFWDGRGGVWAMNPEDPERADTAWSSARRLCDGFLKNKPIVLGDRWLLPVEFMNCDPLEGSLDGLRPQKGPHAHPMPRFKAANVFASGDGGRTVSFFGQAQIPPKDRDCTENMVVERKDGSLWMLVRTKYGIGETFSTDGGKSWTEVKPSAIQNPNSRFYIGRLKSGAMLLVKNGPTDKRIGRSRITAFVSDDDGATWIGGLVLDERDNVSYPDAVEGPDGFIHVVHDRERTKAREILHHRFTEADVRAGRLVTPGSRLKDIVNKAGPKVK